VCFNDLANRRKPRHPKTDERLRLTPRARHTGLDDQNIPPGEAAGCLDLR
jgi:hypothetical protein